MADGWRYFVQIVQGIGKSIGNVLGTLRGAFLTARGVCVRRSNNDE